MGNNTSSPFTPEEALNIIRKLCEEVPLDEQLLEKIMAILQQQAEASTPTSAWMPSQGNGVVIESIQPSQKNHHSHARPHCVRLKPGDVRVTYMDVDDLIKAMGVESDAPIEVGIRRFVECYKKYRCPGDFLGKR